MDLPPLQGMVDGSDPKITLNMRDWLERAIKASGAVIHGKSFGCSSADIDFEIEGVRFNVEIRPTPKHP